VAEPAVENAVEPEVEPAAPRVERNAEALAPAAVHPPEPEAKRFCHWCGRMVSLVATFCPYCGKSLAAR
jgi:hypothetical protein